MVKNSESPEGILLASRFFDTCMDYVSGGVSECVKICPEWAGEQVRRADAGVGRERQLVTNRMLPHHDKRISPVTLWKSSFASIVAGGLLR
jgi:hypothetical protein